jgi:hypothetical protein
MPANRRRPDALPSVELGKLGQVRPRELAIRFGLGAVVSIAAGILAKTVDAQFAGAFLAFPAILPASLTLIQDKEGTRDADRNAVGAVLGGLALVGFAVFAEATFKLLPAVAVLLSALGAWAVASLALYALLALAKPEACDKNQD